MAAPTSPPLTTLPPQRRASHAWRYGTCARDVSSHGSDTMSAGSRFSIALRWQRCDSSTDSPLRNLSSSAASWHDADEKRPHS